MSLYAQAVRFAIANTESIVRMNQARAFVYDYNTINIDYTTQTTIEDDPDYALQLQDALERALKTIETCDKAADAMAEP